MMKKENMFLEKFHLLNSQENSEEIIWSSSDSSEYETIHCNEGIRKVTNKNQNRKRKRKKKALKNISNLDITVVETNKYASKSPANEKSPIIRTKHTKSGRVTSPVSKQSPQVFPPYRSKTMGSVSPILRVKHASPRNLSKIKKNLFNNKIDSEKFHSQCEGRKSPILFSRSRPEGLCKATSSRQISGGVVIDSSNSSEVVKEVRSENSDESLSLLRVNNSLDISKKVQSFFDGNFSSDSPSQPSITESLTQKDVQLKPYEDIEIVSSLTQLPQKLSIEPIKPEPASNSTSPETFDTCPFTKKIRYKKEGLAYRLSKLIKKQTANISLWQHERYLAANTNFIVPKIVYRLFMIKKYSFKYGCGLLDVIDVNNESFLILINSNLLKNFVISDSSVFKLYEPYKIVVLDANQSLILNVCKFEVKEIV